MTQVKLAQIFEVDGYFEPTKVSLYLKRAGYNSASYFDLSDDPSIDSTNFSSISQGNGSVLILEDIYSGWTGNGYLSYQSIAGSGTDAIVRYPIRASSAGIYDLWLRYRSSAGSFSADIYIDGNFVQTITEVPPSTDWEWIQGSFVVPDSETHTLGIVLKELNTSLDKIYIAANSTDPSNEYGGPALTASPFITAHLQLYTLTNEVEPNSPLLIYDYSTTLSDIVADGWYNFALTIIDGSSYDFDSSYAIVFSTSGGGSKNYLIWELVDNDEYFATPSAIKFEND